MTWKPTPEVKALHDYWFSNIMPLQNGIPERKGMTYVCECDAPVVRFERKGGRLCAVTESGMWYILGEDK